VGLGPVRPTGYIPLIVSFSNAFHKVQTKRDSMLTFVTRVQKPRGFRVNSRQLASHPRTRLAGVRSGNMLENSATIRET